MARKRRTPLRSREPEVIDYGPLTPGAHNADPRFAVYGGAGAAPSDIPTAAPDPFVTSPLQKVILAKLDGKALSLSGLEGETKTDRRQLHRKNGLKGLMSRGLVRNAGRGKGYFRPDKPPPMSP